MNGNTLRFLAMIFSLGLLLASVAVPGEINQGDIPEPCVVCGGVGLKYADVDTCWPGDTVSVPVYYTSADSLTYLQIWGTLPAGVSYDTINTSGTPWPGSFVDNSTSDTIEVHLARGDTLLPDTLERLLDVRLVVSDTVAFHQTKDIKFGHNIAACTLGSMVDCDVIDTTLGSITIPNDSVTVIFDSVLAYSYQAVDTTDEAKLDSLEVPVKLYTNFPCSSYVIWIVVPDSLDYLGFDAIEDSVYVEETNTDTLKIYGFPATKPGNDSTHYLCDLKFSVGDFRYWYMGSQTFDTTFYFGFPGSGVSPETHVYSWGNADSVAYDDIDSLISEGVYLPEYEVDLSIIGGDVGWSGLLSVPVKINPSFYTQFYQLYIGFDSTLLNFHSIVQAGGTIPPTSRQWGDTSGAYRIDRYFSSNFPEGKYTEPDSEQTLFTIRYTPTETFKADSTTEIKFFEPVNPNMVYDFFSQDTIPSKIQRIDDSTFVWSMSDDTITYIARINLGCIDVIYHDKEVVQIVLGIGYLNVSGDECEIAYDCEVPAADSITSESWSISSYDTVQVGNPGNEQPTIMHILFGEDVDENGEFVYVWITDQESAGGTFALDGYESWFEYNSGSDTVNITPWQDPCEYEWEQPRLVIDLPDAFTLYQNYPNPFNAQTNISFNMETPGFAELKVFDILGRKVNTLVSEELPAGMHIINWDATNGAGKPIAGGLYFYVLKAGDFQDFKKMLYLK